jgi:hypothetical protein
MVRIFIIAMIAIMALPSIATAKTRYASRVVYCQHVASVIPIVNRATHEDRVQNDVTWEDEGKSDATYRFQRFHECLTSVGL